MSRDRSHGSDEDVATVIALDDELRTALRDRDFDVIEALYGEPFMLNSPAGLVQTREENIEHLRNSTSRQLNYERTIEAAYAAGDVVVIMGKEAFIWESTRREGLDGKRSARRFTNVWQRRDGAWRQIARQATTIGEGRS